MFYFCRNISLFVRGVFRGISCSHSVLIREQGYFEKEVISRFWSNLGPVFWPFWRTLKIGLHSHREKSNILFSKIVFFACKISKKNDKNFQTCFLTNLRLPNILFEKWKKGWFLVFWVWGGEIEVLRVF